MLRKISCASACVILLFSIHVQGQASHTTRSHTTSATTTKTPAVPANLKAAAKPFVAQGCDASLWKHVYHPKRLLVVEQCIVVTGTIHHSKPEADGDTHIQLQLDPEYDALLNNENKTAQAGCLVVEPICQGLVTQPDAISACRDFHSSVQVPPQGKHVKVLGAYVWDIEQDHGWMEIHPVTAITEE